jgi:hypothetical protein
MTRIDHLVYGVPELGAAVDRLELELGVRARPGGSHPQWGTHNALITLSETTYLEILAPDPDRPSGFVPGILGLGDLAQPRLVSWAAKTENLTAAVQAAARRGVRLGTVQTAGRDKPDGKTLSWQLTDPEVVLGDGLVPFLIDWCDSDHPGADVPAQCSLTSFRAEHPDPEGIRALLSAIEVDLPVTTGPVPVLVARLDTPRGTVELR